MDTDTAHELKALRDQVTAIDRALVETINRRIEVVQRIWEHKAEHGLGQVDPERERWLREHLAASNPGPLSPEGLEEIYAAVLDLTKREVGRS